MGWIQERDGKGKLRSFQESFIVPEFKINIRRGPHSYKLNFSEAVGSLSADFLEVPVINHSHFRLEIDGWCCPQHQQEVLHWEPDGYHGVPLVCWASSGAGHRAGCPALQVLLMRASKWGQGFFFYLFTYFCSEKHGADNDMQLLLFPDLPLISANSEE